MQSAVNAKLIELARQAGVPLVATRDVHYLRPEDQIARTTLLAIQLGKTIDELRREDSEIDFSLTAPEEMQKAFGDIPEAVLNTGRIADRCEAKLELGQWNFPNFPLPEGETADSYLCQLAREGLEEKLKPIRPEVGERLEYELEIITRRGFSPYFLVVSDYVQWARGQGIVSTTRGSAAGSLVSFALGVTTVNPLAFRLPFERFLNPSRPSPPDIDMDFADNRRDEVIDYVTRKYGQDKVAQICTFGAMLARGSVRDVGRALGYPYSFCDRVAKMIPFGTQGFPMTIDRALAETAELKRLYDQEAEVRRLLDLARRIEGNARHVSVHAAGVVIGPRALDDFTPLQRESGSEKIITQYEMNTVEAAGLLKMDFLGVRNLSILGQAVKLVRQTKGQEIDLSALPFDDEPTYKLLARGETTGLFQLNGAGLTRYLVELKPTNIFDIMAMVALFRPGPIESIPEFIRRKHNPSLIKYLDPRMKEILNMSYGVITFQDDVLLIAIELAGYTWETVDKLRKAMGKKIPEEMAKQKEKFLQGCQDHGKLSAAQAQELWRLIEPFAAYGFNKSHAASYGVIAYQTAYLKANFPAEFMTAVLTAESGDLETVAEVVNECRKMDIQVWPPDVNESGVNFTYLNDHQIRFGLLAIKNLGEDIARSIIDGREQGGPYYDLADFLLRVGATSFNKKSLEALIRSGALDRFGERSILLANLETLLAFRRDQGRQVNGQVSLFGEQIPVLRLSEAPQTSRRELLEGEKELLGLYVSEHPFAEFARTLGQEVLTIASLTQNQGHHRVRVAGQIMALREITTKTGQSMLFCRLEDLTGQAEIVVFPRVLAESRPFWREGESVLVTGMINHRESEVKIVCETVWALTVENLGATIEALRNVKNQRAIIY